MTATERAKVQEVAANLAAMMPGRRESIPKCTPGRRVAIRLEGVEAFGTIVTAQTGPANTSVTVTLDGTDQTVFVPQELLWPVLEAV